MTIAESLNWATNKLSTISTSPVLDSEVLLSHALKKPREYLLANPEKTLSSLQATNYELLTNKRAKRTPVAYLTGEKEFFGLNFRVTPDVLIPRPETELLVERTLSIIQQSKYKIKKIIDVGTGSGNIIISVAKNIPVGYKIRLLATDISKKALFVAKTNARHHKVLSKIKFIQSDLLKNLSHARKEQLKEDSIVLANLPYLTTKQLKELSIKREPKQALDAGPDGLDLYRKLFSQIMDGKFATHTLLLEHDPSQTNKLIQLAKNLLRPKKVGAHKDLAGKNRFLEVRI